MTLALLTLRLFLTSGGSRIFQGGVTPKMGVPTYYFPKFCQQLHVNERIWTGGALGTRALLGYAIGNLSPEQIIIWSQQLAPLSTRYKIEPDILTRNSH